MAKSGSDNSRFTPLEKTLASLVVAIVVSIGGYLAVQVYQLSATVGELKGSLQSVSQGIDQALRFAQGVKQQQVEEEHDRTPQKTITEASQENVDPFTLPYENQRIMGLLGSPQTRIKKTKLSEQFFEKGRMLWRNDRWKIYVLYDGQQHWDVYDDNAPSVKEISERWTLNIPRGLFEPEGGFKKTWLEEELERTLGWAISKAHHIFDGYVQDFERGVLIGAVSKGPERAYPPDGYIYAFLEEGERRRYEKFDYTGAGSK